MQQPKSFIESGNEHLVCKSKKSIYGLKQASKQWYLKFNEIISFLGFIENKLDQCIYLKVCESKFIVLILNVDDILLTGSSYVLLIETKNMLLPSFDITGLGEAFFVLSIEIHKERDHKLLGLS